jgi:tetratricopeptide (TPR) repeat protein
MRPHGISLVLIVAVCAAAFAGALPNKLLWDDNLIIVDNPGVHDVRQPLKFFTHQYWNVVRADYRAMPQRGYRPIPEVSFAAQYALWGPNPVGFHAVSILVHAANCVLLYLLSLTILKDNRGATFCALLFAAHPIHVEAVVWAKAQSELLAVLFLLVGMLTFSRCFGPAASGKWRYLLLCSIAACALALMCKASAAVLPALLALYVWCFVPRARQRRGAFALIPFAGVVGVFFAVKATLPYIPDKPTVETGSSFLTGLSALAVYLRLLVVPAGLCAHHRVYTVMSLFDSTLLRVLPMGVALLGAAVVALRRSRVAFFALLWLIISLAPLSLMELMGRRVGELRAYTPSVGFCLLLAFLLSSIPALASARISRTSLNRAAAALCAFLVVAYTGLSAMRSLDWADPFTFWSDTLEKNPDSWHALSGLSEVYAKNGRHEEAIVLLERFVSIATDRRNSRYRLATLYQATDRVDDAVALYEALAAEDQADSRALIALASIRGKQGEHEIAMSLFRRGLEIAPLSPYAHRQLGIYHSRMGRYPEAIAELEETLRLKPDDGPTLQMLGITYATAGREADAMKIFQKCLEVDPTRLQVWLSMGECYEKMGNPAEAARCYQEAIKAGDPLAKDAKARLAHLARQHPR